jgi:hypothetical protein
VYANKRRGRRCASQEEKIRDQEEERGGNRGLTEEKGGGETKCVGGWRGAGGAGGGLGWPQGGPTRTRTTPWRNLAAGGGKPKPTP